MEVCGVNKFSPAWRPTVYCCEHGNEPLGIIMDDAFYEQTNEYSCSVSSHMESVCKIILPMYKCVSVSVCVCVCVCVRV
jgi:hypothetical protein